MSSAGTANAKTPALLPGRLDRQKRRCTLHDPHPSALSRPDIPRNVRPSRLAHTEKDGRHVDDVANDSGDGNARGRVVSEGRQERDRGGDLWETSAGCHAAAANV
jgi:hypothetical protein